MPGCAARDLAKGPVEITQVLKAAVVTDIDNLRLALQELALRLSHPRPMQKFSGRAGKILPACARKMFGRAARQPLEESQVALKILRSIHGRHASRQPLRRRRGFDSPPLIFQTLPRLEKESGQQNVPGRPLPLKIEENLLQAFALHHRQQDHWRHALFQRQGGRLGRKNPARMRQPRGKKRHIPQSHRPSGIGAKRMPVFRTNENQVPGLQRNPAPVDQMVPLPLHDEKKLEEIMPVQKGRFPFPANRRRHMANLSRREQLPQPNDRNRLHTPSLIQTAKARRRASIFGATL